MTNRFASHSQVHAQIRAAGFHVDIDMTDRTIQKKVPDLDF